VGFDRAGNGCQCPNLTASRNAELTGLERFSHRPCERNTDGFGSIHSMSAKPVKPVKSADYGHPASRNWTRRRDPGPRGRLIGRSHEIFRSEVQHLAGATLHHPAHLHHLAVGIDTGEKAALAESVV